MGYPKDMWKNRSFIDFIHPNDRMTFVNYITSILTDPCMITKAGMFKKYILLTA